MRCRNGIVCVKVWPVVQRPVLKAHAAAAALLALAACSGGGGSTSTPSPTPTPTSTPVPIVTTGDIVRLSKQASFGPTLTLTTHIATVGTTAWIDEQLAATGSSYADLTTRAVAKNFCTLMASAMQSVCNRDYMSSFPVAYEFYAHAATGTDQLRQRVAFALSQIIVTSDLEVHSTAGTATINQLFLDNAFGNYRTLLRAVTLNPYMGAYLNLADSAKAAPNENYARELMQLFSTGVDQLNADGSVKTDGTGAPLTNYTAADVHDIARALTGWTYARLPGAAANDGNALDYSAPMVPIAANYDTGVKTFLGTTVAAGATQTASLDAVADAVFNNASTAPYVSKFLIQQLVMSNPSPAYIARISAVFANDGAGVRGNLRAVIRAILLDADARGDAKTGLSDGKLKEPVLYMMSLARLMAVATDGYAFATRDAGMAQAPFRAPSVFNFYPPDYPLPLGGGLLSPATKLMTASTILARHNFAYDWNFTTPSEWAVQATITGATGTTPNWTEWEAITDVNAIADRIDLLMLNKTMTATQRTALLAAVNAVTNADPAMQARKRAQTALYIVASSPLFQVDR